MLAGASVVMLIATALGSRFRRCSWYARAFIVAVVMVVPFGLALAWFVVVQRHAFAIIYVHPIFAPAAVGAAAMIVLPFEGLARWARPLRWIPTLAAGALVASVAPDIWLPLALPPTAFRSWNLDEARVVADQAIKRGWSYGDIALHLQGSACRELLAGLSMMAPAPAAPPRHGRRQLQVVKASREAFGVRDDLIELGGQAALLRDIESWLQPGGLKACRVPIAAEGEPACAAVAGTPADAETPERFMFLRRSVPLIDQIDRERPYVATYEIPLVPTAGEDREIAISDDSVSPCVWRITRVEGVQVEGTLPAVRVRLHAARSGNGLIVFEKPFGTGGCGQDIDFRYPPCVLETPLDDPLQDLMVRS
jgi:hypothetical protein